MRPRLGLKLEQRWRVGVRSHRPLSSIPWVMGCLYFFCFMSCSYLDVDGENTSIQDFNQEGQKKHLSLDAQ